MVLGLRGGDLILSLGGTRHEHVNQKLYVVSKKVPLKGCLFCCLSNCYFLGSFGLIAFSGG